MVYSRAQLATFALAALLAGCGSAGGSGVAEGAATAGQEPEISSEPSARASGQDLGIILPTQSDLETFGFIGFEPAVDSSGQGDFNAAWPELTPEQRAQVSLDSRVQSIDIEPAICRPAFGFIWAVEDGDPANQPVAAGRSTFSDDGNYQVSQNDRVVRVVAHKWSSPQIAKTKFEEFAEVALRCLEFVVLSDGGEFSVKYGDQVLKSADQISYLGAGGLLQISGYVGDVTFTVNLKDVAGVGSKGGELVGWLSDELTQWQARPSA